MGYSVGRWEGDTLVVESNGYADKSWLDFDGHPHTEDLRITERYTRRDVGHIDVHVTMVDPKAYLKPITFSMPMALQADTEMLEFYCDNNKSRERLAATTAAQAVDVPAATLSRYVGVYDVVDRNGNKTVAAITLTGTTLWLDYDGKGKEVLIAVSPTQFSVVRHGHEVLHLARRRHEPAVPLRRGRRERAAPPVSVAAGLQTRRPYRLSGGS